jgi:signal transduction histidine kinase
MKDSLISVERAEAIKKYDLLNTTKKKDEEIADQNEKIQNQEVVLLRKNNQLLLLMGGLGFIALLTALLFFIYNKNKQLNLQRIQVLEKEKETQRMKSIIEGEEKERKRFAQELHDGLGAVLATVKMQISGIPNKFPKVQSSETYQKAESLIDDACRTVREISHDLMPYVLEQQGLLPAIDDMCQNLGMHHNVSFDFIPFGNENELSDVIKITLYRITQELLKNIIKHAQATEVIVQLTIEEEEIILIVEDNGIGFNPALYRKGIGIENIKSRAEYLHGTLDVDSIINQGSTFTIELPKQQN